VRVYGYRYPENHRRKRQDDRGIAIEAERIGEKA
jgi:hypothetical protein